MTIEQKAKAYDLAIRKAEELIVTSVAYDKFTIEKIFPELKESEEEKNIKNLIDELKCSLRAANCQNDACGGGHEKRIALLEWSIAWLEKQGEEKLSLRPQNRLKPSDEQMEALRKASKNEYLTAEQYDILVSLYNDLQKKL